MQTFDIIKTSTPSSSFRAAQIKGMFDLQADHIEERFTGALDLPDKWNVGLIYGASGTGKSSIAQQLFDKELIQGFEYNGTSVIDDMPDGDIKRITGMFNSVGFSSPPSWLKPYSVLSNGEKMRVDLARALLAQDQLVVFDEFTSVVDRNVAQIGSYAVQKAIRKLDRQFIAVSCHDDILEWLQPDWTFNTDRMEFESKKKYTRPDINLEVVSLKGQWNTFRRYHYLDTALNNAAHQYVGLINGRPVAFIGVFHFPHPKHKNMKKVHRLVVLPDYQGIGIGGRLLDYVGEKYVKDGFKFTITTSTPALLHALKKNPKWRLMRAGRLSAGSTSGKIHNSTFTRRGSVKRNTSSVNRITTSWEYTHA